MEKKYELLAALDEWYDSSVDGIFSTVDCELNRKLDSSRSYTRIKNALDGLSNNQNSLSRTTRNSIHSLTVHKLFLQKFLLEVSKAAFITPIIFPSKNLDEYYKTALQIYSNKYFFPGDQKALLICILLECLKNTTDVGEGCEEISEKVKAILKATVEQTDFATMLLSDSSKYGLTRHIFQVGPKKDYEVKKLIKDLDCQIYLFLLDKYLKINFKGEAAINEEMKAIQADQ